MSSQPSHDVRFLYDLKVPMRDGVRLSADVFLPRAEQDLPLPTILLRTPYETTRDGHIEWAVWWARRGYACVIQDARGKYESEGTFYAYHDEGKDGHDTLEWIAQQPWSNGKIGTSGRSYGGIFQWQLAPYRSPHLTAMAPQVIMGDYFSECHRIGGAVQLALTITAPILFTTSVSFIQMGCRHLFGNQRFYRHLPLIETDVEAIGRPIPFYRDWMEHTTYDDYWAAIDTHKVLDQIDVPIVQQGGWYDPYTAGDVQALERDARARIFRTCARESETLHRSVDAPRPRRLETGRPRFRSRQHTSI